MQAGAPNPRPQATVPSKSWVSRASLSTGKPACVKSVGPLYVPGETSCYACYLLRRRANVGYAEELEALEQAPAAYPSAPPLELAAAGLAALVALRWLAFADPFVPGVVWTLELTSGPWLARHEVFRVPRCSACSGLGDTAPPAPWFEESAR